MRPLVYTHRGGAGLAPENTVSAFDHGLSFGADGIEFDVHLSRDGVPVVMHDAAVDRTTDGTGSIAEFTAAELAQLDAGYRFEVDGAFPFRGRGIGVPSLPELLERYRDTALIIELKAPDVRLARAVVDAVRAADMAQRVTIGSFHDVALDAVRAYDPSLRTGADTDEIREVVTATDFRPRRSRVLFHAYQVPEVFAGMRIVTPQFVERAHEAGAQVVVWTVNEAADIVRLLDWGVDTLITDRPDRCVPAVEEWAGGKGLGSRG